MLQLIAFQFGIPYGMRANCRIARDLSMIELPYYVKYIVGVALIAVGLGAINYGRLVFKAGWDDQHDQPDIVLRKTAFFWIEIEKDIYQIGVVIRLFNLGDKPYLVRGVALNATRALW